MINRITEHPFRQARVIGSGMNESKLTEEQCWGVLINWNIAFESLSNDDSRVVLNPVKVAGHPAKPVWGLSSASGRGNK